MIYNDIRKFGFIKFINRLDLDQNVHLKHLGPEPLSTKFNIGYFKKLHKGKRKNNKRSINGSKFISHLGIFM